MSRHLARIGAPVLAILALAGCGSSSKTTSTSSSAPGASSTAAVTADPAIAATVPAKFKSKGTLNVASEAQYAPNEFIAPDGHTVIGMDADLIDALAKVMGLKVNIINSNFETIIPGLAAGRYDIGISSFTDTKEREKTVDFVDYYKAGVSFYAKSASNTGVTKLADLCGKSVAVEKGTVELEEAEKQDKACKKEGKKSVSVLSFPGQNPVNLALQSGRAEIGFADSPVVAYQIKQSNGAFKLIGETFDVAPYGIAIPKKSGMTAPVMAALKKLMADGTYTQILTKWGIQSGAITEPKINGAIS
jgi:polar amino acid transport system substrate-binding protein